MDPIKEAMIRQDDELRMAADRLGARVSELETKNERLTAALDRCLVGGNHIATYRTDRWPEIGSDHEHALRILCATPEYDMWCCWNAIMQARNSIEDCDGLSNN